MFCQCTNNVSLPGHILCIFFCKLEFHFFMNSCNILTALVGHNMFNKLHYYIILILPFLVLYGENAMAYIARDKMLSRCIFSISLQKHMMGVIIQAQLRGSASYGDMEEKVSIFQQRRKRTFEHMHPTKIQLSLCHHENMPI